MDLKSGQEWIVMRHFADLCPGFPKGRLVKSESPDFRLIISPRHTIGIELTIVAGETGALPGHGVLRRSDALLQVAGALRRKEEKSRLYNRGQPDELWLIIFADYSETGAMNRLDGETDRMDFGKSFDRLYFFDVDTHRIIHLK